MNMQVLITGANSGIGFETARQLLEKNYDVWIVCRDEKKNNQTFESLKPYGVVKIAGVMDLQDLESARMFVTNFRRKVQYLNILVNNAGVMAISELQRTKQGFEAHVGINFLSHYLLTRLLIDLLIEGSQLLGSPSRIINVSGDAYAWSTPPSSLDVAFLGNESSYNAHEQYGYSKLFQIFDSVIINRLFASTSNNPKIISFSLHPGEVVTNLFRQPGPIADQIKELLNENRTSLKTVEEGARTTTFCATASLSELNVQPPFIDYSSQQLYYRDLKKVSKFSKIARDETLSKEVEEYANNVCNISKL